MIINFYLFYLYDNKIMLYIVLAIVVVITAIGVYLYLTRARDYRIEIKNFKNSELFELTFKDTSGNIIIRNNGRQAGVVRKTTNLFKANNLEFDIGHVKLKEIIIMGKFNDVNLILYRDNEPIDIVNNLTEDASISPLVYQL